MVTLSKTTKAISGLTLKMGIDAVRSLKNSPYSSEIGIYIYYYYFTLSNKLSILATNLEYATLISFSVVRPTVFSSLRMPVWTLSSEVYLFSVSFPRSVAFSRYSDVVACGILYKQVCWKNRIMSNQLNLSQVDSNQSGKKTFKRWTREWKTSRTGVPESENSYQSCTIVVFFN